MMTTDRWVQIIAGSLIALCLIASGILATSITAEAGRAQLTYTDEVTAGDPPEVALGIAMGAFRGLFVNWLWIRATNLKQEGKFFEAIQLAEAITRLQPRFPRVWAFHAWNMAYNISVATHTADERWQWVKEGIELLRNEAIPRNPNNILLHKELAWIFIHKIQGFADDANHFYKERVANEWTIILGEPPRLDGTRDQNIETMAQWLMPVVTSRDTLAGVIDAELRWQEESGIGLNDHDEPESGVAELAKRIREDAGLPLGMELLRFVQYRVAQVNSYYMTESGNDLPEGFRNDVIDELMSTERYANVKGDDGIVYAGPWIRLLSFVRRRVIIDEMHMEPVRMQRYTRKYGPLDWRHPASHALYWASRGVDEGLERISTTQFDTLNTDRVAVHSIQELYRFGEIQYDFLSNEYLASVKFDWADTYGSILEEVMNADRGDIAADSEQRSFTLYGAGYENFLRDVIRTAYNRDELATAEKYHSILRNWPGLNVHDERLEQWLTLPLEEFVRLDMQDQLSNPQVAVSEAESALMSAFTSGLGRGDRALFARKVEYAQRVRQGFFELQDIRTLIDPESQRMQEYMEPTFAEFVGKILLRVLRGTGNAEFVIGPRKAGEIYRRTPLGLQRIVYDDLIRELGKPEIGLSPETLRGLFPEPPGLAVFREQLKGLDDASKSRLRAIEWQKQ